MVRAKQRKRELYSGVAADLAEIDAIRAAERLLRDALDEGDWPRAIELCVQCRQALAAYAQFTCLASFSALVQRSWDALESRLEHGLREVVGTFDAVAYHRLLVAHRRMGRGFHVLERLQRQFIDTINAQTQRALYAHVLQSPDNAVRAEELLSLPFKALADALADEHFVACLHTILEYLAALLYAHYQMTEWHAARSRARTDTASSTTPHNTENNDNNNSTNDSNNKDDDEDDDVDVGPAGDAAFFDSLHASLLRFRKPMWDKMQRKVSAILSTSALASYKIDDFLLVLDSVYRFIEIGEAFSGANSDHLRRSIKQQSKAYFENLHKARIEDLATMLSHDQWVPCPVADNFLLERVKEFDARGGAPARQQHSATVTAAHVFEQFAATGNPFAVESLNSTRHSTNKYFIVFVILYYFISK